MTAGVLTRCNVNVVGNRNAAETVVLAHGFGGDQTAWRFVVPGLEADYRIVLFDLVGCGGSDPDAYDRARYATLWDFADDLIRLCDALGLRQATLVGHSVSCMIGGLASIRRPDLFARQVWLGASPCYLNAGDYGGGFAREEVADLLNAMSKDYNTWVRGIAPLAVNAADQPTVVDEFARTMGSMRPDVAVGVASTIFLADHRRDVADIAVPVLIVQARDDFFVPEGVAHYLHRVIRGSRLRRIALNGHLPHLTSPAEVVAVLKEFLASAV